METFYINFVSKVSKSVYMDNELRNILQKVGCLYQKYGIKSVTMDDVARELGISKKTLYQYVNDKSDLVAKVIDLDDQMKREKFHENNTSENAIDQLIYVHREVNKMLRETNPSMMYDLKKYYPDLHDQMMERKRKGMFENVLKNLKWGIEDGLYRDELNVDIIAKLYLSRIESIMDHEIYTIEEFTSPKFFREIFIYHIRGIANKKGIEYLEKNIEKLNTDSHE